MSHIVMKQVHKMPVNKSLKAVPSLIDSENIDSPTKPIWTLRSHCRVRGGKRKAGTNLQLPSKRWKVEAIKVSVIDLTQSSDEELPVEQTPTTTKKRDVSITRTSTFTGNSLFSVNTSRANIDNPTKPIWTLRSHCRVRGGKRKAGTNLQLPSKRKKVEAIKVSVVDMAQSSDEELPVEQTPTTTKKRDVSITCTSTFTGNSLFSVNTSRDDFNAKYMELNLLGAGGFGSVYAGYRKTDNFPVAIKYILRNKVIFRRKGIKKKKYMIPLEVVLMQTMACGEDSVGKSAAVSLLDWYKLKEEVILVMERPVPCEDLKRYMKGPLDEHETKDIMKQLVDASIQMLSVGVFHRDIKRENVLIEKGSAGIQVRIIDFGCGCFVRKEPFRTIYGTSPYFPPEYSLSRRYEAGPTTVWQLGALMYEVLSGDSAFRSSKLICPKNNLNSKMDKLNLTKDCNDLLRKCLSVTISNRVTLKQMQSHPWFN